MEVVPSVQNLLEYAAAARWLDAMEGLFEKLPGKVKKSDNLYPRVHAAAVVHELERARTSLEAYNTLLEHLDNLLNTPGFKPIKAGQEWRKRVMRQSAVQLLAEEIREAKEKLGGEWRGEDIDASAYLDALEAIRSVGTLEEDDEGEAGTQTEVLQHVNAKMHGDMVDIYESDGKTLSKVKTTYLLNTYAYDRFAAELKDWLQEKELEVLGQPELGKALIAQEKAASAVAEVVKASDPVPEKRKKGGLLAEKASATQITFSPPEDPIEDSSAEDVPARKRVRMQKDTKETLETEFDVKDIREDAGEQFMPAPAPAPPTQPGRKRMSKKASSLRQSTRSGKQSPQVASPVIESTFDSPIPRRKRAAKKSPNAEVDDESPLPVREDKPKKRRRWTTEEMTNLIAGVESLGTGNWALIRAAYEFDKRSNVDLKDKWRNMTEKFKRDGVYF